MFKKWRSCVSLLVCLSCMLSMLFLNTLKVEASSSSFSLSSSVKFTYSNTHTTTTVSGYISGISGGGGFLSNGSGNIMSNSGGGGSISSIDSGHGSLVSHVKMPFTIRKSLSDLGISGISTDSFIKLNMSVSSVSNTASGASRFTVSNIGVYDSEGKLLSAGSSSLSLPTDIVQLGKIIDSSNTVILNYIIEYDVEAEGSVLPSNTIQQLTVTTSFEGSVSASVATTQEVNSSSTPVTDSKGHELQEESNNIQEETKTTTNNIFDTITSFFGSFFVNIKNALVSVFVPEDGYFSNWFNRLNTMLSNKLGILYAPFDFFISVFNRLNEIIPNSSNYDSTITFPAIEFTNKATGETYHFLSKQTVRLSQYNIIFDSSDNSSIVGTEGFTSLFVTIRYFNCFIMTFALFSLLRKKLNLIIRGADYDS